MSLLIPVNNRGEALYSNINNLYESINNNFVKKDNAILRSNLDLNGFKIINSAEPVNKKDCVTKNFLMKQNIELYNYMNSLNSKIDLQIERFDNKFVKVFLKPTSYISKAKNNSKKMATENVNPSAPIYPNLNEINTARFEEFMTLKEMYSEMIKKYEKVKRRWSSADNILKYTGLTLVSITAVLGSVTPVGIPIVAITGVGSFIILSTKFISYGFTKKRKKLYKRILKLLDERKIRLDVFQDNALKDEKITPEEMKTARYMVFDTKYEISVIKSAPGFQPNYNMKDCKNLDKKND